MPRQSSHLLFLCIALMVLLPPRVQAALPKELPAAPAKFLTGACLTRTEDLWITAEAGGIGNVPNRRLRRFGNSRRIFAADVGFQGKNVRSIHGGAIIHPRDRALPRRPVTGGRERSQPDSSASYNASMRNSCSWSSQMAHPSPHDAISPPNQRSSCSLHTSGKAVRRSLRVSDLGMSPAMILWTMAGDSIRSRIVCATPDLS